MADHKALPPLDLSGSSSQVATKWRKWKRAFEYYAEGKGLDNTRKKTSQLLHFAGMEVQDIFEDIVDPEPGEDQDPYAVCIRKLDNHFRYEENLPFERHVFRQLAPTDGEPVDKFVVRLRQQARHCNFGASLDDNLRDQLIEKLPDMELKKKLLETRNITLAQVLEKTRASEAAGQQVKHMAGGSDVHAVRKKEEKANDQICFNCGKTGHFSRDSCCPAKGKKCAKCSRYGHFAKCCKSYSRTTTEKGREAYSKKAGDYKRRSERQANQVEDYVEGNSHGEENPAFAFAVTEENEEDVCKVSSPSEPTMNVAVEGNIGSGKTSLLKFFKQNPLVEVIEEPVKKWQNVGGGNTLELMYNDPKRWSYLFESYVLLTMMEIHHRPQTAPVRLLERSAYSASFCFMENLQRSGMLSSVEYTVFQEWFEFLMSQQKPQIDLIVYLRTSPEKCMERIKQRSRNEETSVSMELLNSLHDRYEEWLIKKSKFYVPAPIVVIDGNQSLDDMFQFYETNKQLILGINCSKAE